MDGADMRNDSSPLLILLALVPALGAPNAHADLGPGSPGSYSPPIRTGPLVTERLMERDSRTTNFGETASNTKATTDAVHKLIDTVAAGDELETGHATTREAWSRQEQRQGDWKLGGQDAREAVALHKSFAAAEITTYAGATEASTLQSQDIQAAMNDIDPGFRAKFGCGVSCQAVQAVTLACEAKLPNRTASDGFAQTGLFGACQYDEEVSGSCENPNKLNSHPTGVKIKGGHKHTRAIAACTALVGLVPGINAKRVALGYPSMRAWMQAELTELRDRKRLAGLPFKDPLGVLSGAATLKTGTENGGEVANQALENFGMSIARAGAGTVVNQYLANGTVPGSDQPYKYAAAANLKATGRPSCAESGWQGSRNCRASELAGAYAHSASSSGAEEGTPMGHSQLVTQIAIAGELARNRIDPSGGPSSGGLSMPLVESLRDLASIIMAPEFATYALNMSDDEIKANVAWAQDALQRMDVQVASNLDHQRRLASPATQLASAPEAGTVTVDQLFAAFGVTMPAAGHRPWLAVDPSGAFAAVEPPDIRLPLTLPIAFSRIGSAH